MERPDRIKNGGIQPLFSSARIAMQETKSNPFLIIFVFLSMAVFASGDLLEIIPAFSAVIAHPLFPYFHEVHDLLALMVALYVSHKMTPTIGRLAVVWFFILHIPYYYITFPGHNPELFRLAILGAAAFLGVYIIAVRHRLEAHLNHLMDGLNTQRNAERRRADTLEAIREVGQQITSILDPETLMTELMLEIQKHLGYDNVSLWLVDQQAGEIIQRASLRKPGKLLLDRDLRLKMGEGITGWVAQRGEPLLVNDTLSDGHFYGDREAAPRSELCVPLKVSGRVIGVIGFQKFPVNAFVTEDQFLLQTLADQVAIALENARLFQEMRLYKNAFSSTADAVVVTDLESRILDANPSFEQLTGFSPAEFIGQKMSIVKSQHTTLEFYQNMWEKILRKGYWRGEIINRKKNGEEWHSWNTISTIRNERGQPVAYVGVNRDITVLKQAEETLRRRAEELALINHISTAINQPLTLADVLTNTLRELTRALFMDRGTAAIFTDARDKLTVIAVYDPAGDSPAIGGYIPVYGNPTIEYILREQRYLSVVNGNHSYAPAKTRPLVPVQNVKSLLVVPLIAQDQVIGMIELDSIQVQRQLSEDEITLAQTIAHQAATAIQKAHLFESESTRRAELGSLYDLSRALADAAYDFDAILDLIVRYAVDTIHVTLARITLAEAGCCRVRKAHSARPLDPDLDLMGAEHAIEDLPNCFRVAQNNTPIVFHRGDPDLTQAESEILFAGGVQTACLVPLRVAEKALGLLILGEERQDEREPFTPEKIRLAHSIGDQAVSALRRAELFNELEESYLQTVYALANAVDARDTYTADHAQRLAGMALAVGQELGLSARQMEDLRYGAILHDIGKIGIPDAILKKPSALNPGEWKVMREHPEIGARILAPIPRLAGEAIPLGARILTVVDAYSAILDERVYKSPRPYPEAVAELKRHSNAQFDPRVVDVFLRLLEDGLEQSFPT
ncbi:MAG: GAF domain-containing protein [Chloroflexota bacterium]